MDYEINENCLCVLKLEDARTKDVPKMILDYVPIASIELLRCRQIIESMQAKNMIDSIELLELTNSLIEPSILALESFILTNKDNNKDFTYCRNLHSAYQGIEFNFIYSLMKKKEWQENINLLNYEDTNTQSQLRDMIKKIAADLDFMLKIITIKVAYQQCEEDKDIKFYSHRKRGWAGPIIELNSTLSAKFDTNFGFGEKSYFYMKLIYKGINIIPFSDLIRYRNIGEIKSFTRKFIPDNRDWQDAMEFVKDAYNLLMENEISFIQEFIVDEIQNLPKNLYTVMTEDAFYFDDIKYEYD